VISRVYLYLTSLYLDLYLVLICNIGFVTKFSKGKLLGLVLANIVTLSWSNFFVIFFIQDKSCSRYICSRLNSKIQV